MSPDEFRDFGHRLIDWIADYRSTVGQRPVMARTAPGEISAQFPASAPERPEGFDAIFRDLERVILPGHRKGSAKGRV
jgi:aromatic-L-amino-acid decarboxylase